MRNFQGLFEDHSSLKSVDPDKFPFDQAKALNKAHEYSVMPSSFFIHLPHLIFNTSKHSYR